MLRTIPKRLRRTANLALSPFGLKLIPKHHESLVYQHDYGSGGVAKYRQLQAYWNKVKFERVWADETTLSVIAKDIQSRSIDRNGLCHGARNGWEVEWFAKELGCPVTGTDISETAQGIANMVQHDFHEVREDWIGKFSFIYTNSLDQAFDPKKALDAWVDQLTDDGCIYIEHTMLHSPSGASEMDPFGAHPMVMPYLLFEWGKGRYRLDDVLHVDEVAYKNKDRVWVFVIAKERAPARTGKA